ncbi:DUF262 domain-containing protein [Corallococcus exercitus]|uniref:DUF262 domain-containing protein n=1 Tax=Corallococcus exercitus TaxID=2316736 RepID=UPI001ABF5C11|nr:DUF262 domain-containing protein [Corallococcus exercitus]
MAAEILGAQYPLLKVLSNDFVFNIPLYQRPYAWTEEQTGELLDDVLGFMGAPGDKLDALPPYFLGSIVLIKLPEKPDSDVVDGQQRLTTLSILLAGLRSTIQNADIRAALTTRLYEPADALAGNGPRYRLTLREKDADFFRTYVQEEGGFEKLAAFNSPATDAQRHVRANALYLTARLQGLSESERIHLARYLIQRCYLIVVSTPDLNSAYRIFSVLNDRGLDLSHSDILKADVIGKVRAERQELYNRKWEDAEAALGRDAFAELFSHIRMMYVREKPRDSILKEFRTHVRPAERPEEFIDKTLLPLADAFEVVRTYRYESDRGAEQVNTLLRWLDRIDNRDWVPSAILAVSRLRGQPERLHVFLVELERLAALMMLRRANVNERIERYALVLKDLHEGRDPFAEGAAVYGDDDLDRKGARAALDGDLYLLTKVRMYVLTRLDELLSDAGATYDHETLTVEHVLPQSPAEGSRWREWFPEVQQREEWVHRLGNLVLLTRRKNAEASNLDFEEKKSKYFHSPKTKSAVLALTVEVLREARWTPEVLEQRHQRLVETLGKAWRI